MFASIGLQACYQGAVFHVQKLRDVPPLTLESCPN